MLAACPACGWEGEAAPDLYVCPRCRGNVEIRLPAGAAWRWEDLARDADRSIGRYAALLPVRRESLPPLAVGPTPLLPAPALARAWSLDMEVLVKDETRLPSASFKDRASAVALARAREIGAKVVAGASTGNAASSTACLGASAGVRPVIFVPRAAPRAKIAQLQVFGAQVLLVDGNYDAAFDLCLEISRRRGWFCRNTGYNPWTREGKKTSSFEVAEAMRPSVPDAVIVPTGDGNIASGVWKGWREMRERGLVERTPRVIAAQASGSDWIARAFSSGGPVPPIRAETIADSISVDLPRDGAAAVAALRESGGAPVVVSDDEILAAQKDLARTTGIFAEPAAAAAAAGLKRAAAEGLVRAGETVVILLTGNGLKDIDAAMRGLALPPVVPADPAAFERAALRLDLPA